MLFENTQMAALLDFDEVTREPFVWDIANAMYICGREGRGSFNLRPPVVEIILNQYREQRSLSREERAATPMILAMKFPGGIEYYRYCQSIGEDIEGRFHREVVMMESLRNAIAVLGQGIFE